MIPLLLMIAGASLVVAGTALLSPPAAVIVVGLAFIAAGWDLAS